MNEEVKISEATKEIQNASEEELRSVVENWYERTRTDGMKLGARFISAAIYGAYHKHIVKKEKASLRDYKRMTDEILKIVSVQLTQQNESEEQNDQEDTEI
jgi:hypothetical protein